MQVWLNGQFVDRDHARVSVFDAGFQHAVGLFETMLARHGAVFRAADHVKRLADSARDLLLTERLRVEPLIEALTMTLERNGLQEARLRLTITGGDLNLLQSATKSHVDPTILIVAQPPTVYPDHFFDRGVIVLTANGRENPLHPMAGHKTVSYWPRIRELQLAAANRAGEALWFSVSNHLCGGCVSNVILVKDDELLTPIARGEEAQGALPSPVLPGITRAAILGLAEDLDVPVHRRLLDVNDLLAADEVMLTNSSWGVLPVVGVEREKVGEGEVGPLTRQLREGWQRLVDEETQAANL